MLQFTCGSTQPLDYSQYDGIVAGYHLSLWEPPKALDIPDKIYRAQFLYGHRDKSPCPLSGCETIVEWVHKRVSKFPQVQEWVLINEFTDDLGVPYPGYALDDLKYYCEAAYLANPNARLIIGDFKPYLLKKWEAIARIISDLEGCGFPVEIGIQTHLKFSIFNPFRWNAPIVLMLLPSVVKMFSVPIHFIEASLWYRFQSDTLTCDYLWHKLEAIAMDYKIKSFCNWWLHPADIEVGRRMPTFELLKLYSGDDRNGMEAIPNRE